MPRVKETRYCARCDAPFYRNNGNTDAKYCSILCACRDRNTKQHQRKAGKAGIGAKGATLYLIGHYYCCEGCKRVMDEFGIAEVIICDS